jgi:predicted metalloprotease with PDZ domain
LATAKAIQALIKQVKFGWLADASEKKEIALTPKEESTPGDTSAANKARSDTDLATAKAIQARNKQVKFGQLADASEENEAALTPKEESTPEDTSAANTVHAFKGSIGVSIRPVTDGLANALNVKPARGALVAGIDENGPAKAAGIESSDVIVEVDGKDVKEWRDLPSIVADTPIGKNVAVTIIRKGKELTKTVKVGRLEDAAKQAPFTSRNESAPQDKPVAVDSKPQAGAKYRAPGEGPQRLASNASFLTPPAPPRFGKRRVGHFSKASH